MESPHAINITTSQKQGDSPGKNRRKKVGSPLKNIMEFLKPVNEIDPGRESTLSPKQTVKGDLATEN